MKLFKLLMVFLLLQMQLSSIFKKHSSSVFLKHKTLTQKNPSVYLVGNFVETIYTGKWKSNQKNQKGFIESKSGLINLAFDHLDNDNHLLFAFEIFENFYLDSNFLLGRMKIPITSVSQKSLKRTEKVTLKKFSEFYSPKGDLNNSLTVDITLQNIYGKQLDLTADYSEIIISGQIYSPNHDINLEFQVYPKKVELVQVLIFLLINILAFITSVIPFFNAVKNQDFILLSKTENNVLLINICVDFMIISINTTFSMRILIYYLEYLLVLTLYIMIVIMFKMKVYMLIFQQKIASSNLSLEQIKQKRFNFFMKIFFVIMFSIFISFFMVVHYYLFILIAAYPLIQVLYNACCNVRRHCFRTNYHLMIFLPQIIFPLFCRGFSFDFFQLKSDHKFAFMLITISLSLILIMYLQKLLGPCFFLPKLLRPNFYVYDKNIEDLNNEDRDCPICFESIKSSQNSITDDSSTNHFINDKYMQTPCGHSFHSSCLKIWMDQKFICPCCRTNIPAYDN